MAPAPGGGWQRPVRRVLSIGLFFVVWHYSTKWDVDLYVRFQNIPTPWEVLEEAATQLRGAAFYGHILASLERIWLGFRSEEHTSELQSHSDLVCRLLLEKKN